MNTEIFQANEYGAHEFSPKLAALVSKWFAGDAGGSAPRKYDSDSVIDFGAGPGRYCQHLAATHRFKSVIGVEGCVAMTLPEGAYNQQKSQQPHQMIQWDLSVPLWLGVRGHVMSIEVAEHLHAQHHDTFMDTLSRHCTGKLLLTWAVPGQGGLRHVAERTQEQVVPYVRRWGFTFLPEESEQWREIVGVDLSWFKKSIYLFQR